jgi:AcrR family transcriptional regulator
MRRHALATRGRIVEAASRLFYRAGIGAVSVDAIAEKAGITKRTLYNHFRSKDQLITAYLEARDSPNVKAFAGWFAEAPGDLPARVEAIFARLAEAARHPKWRGCGFLRTAAELVGAPGHPALKAGSHHKKNVESWLASLFSGYGAREPEALSRQIVLLIDGAFSAMLLHRDAAYIAEAGRAAATLVAAHTRRSSPTRH